MYVNHPLSRDPRMISQKWLAKVIVSCVFVWLLVSLGSTQVHADTITNKPLKCVSLREGQICTQRVLIRWQATVVSDYCVYSSARSEPMACWSRTNTGEHRFLFKSNTDLILTLRNKENVDIAASTFTVSWVYKNRRKRSGWRGIWKLF